MKYRKLATFSLAASLALVLPITSKAELDLTATPIIGITQSDLHYLRKNDLFLSGDDRYAKYTAFSLSWLVSGKDWYGIIAADIPMGADQFWANNSMRTTERTDYSVTIGRRMGERLSLFGGYIDSETVFTSSGVTSFLEHQYDTGPFLGASYSLYRGENGTLAANIGYAYLDGNINREGTGEYISDGTTKGYKYGLNWTGRIGRGSNYLIGYKKLDYTFDGSSVYGGGAATGNETISKELDVLSFAIVLSTN